MHRDQKKKTHRTRILTTSKVVFDFETRSTVDLKLCGSYAYSEHEDTEILCLCAHVSDQHQIILWIPHRFGLSDAALNVLGEAYDLYIGKNIPEPLDLALCLDYEFIAHNAEFDYGIWNNVCATRYGWPRIEFEQLMCSMGQCSRNGLPGGLDAAGAILKVMEQKDKVGSSLITQMCKPHKKPKKEVYEYVYTEEKHVQMIHYCAQDIRATAAVVEASFPMNDSEKWIWQETARINERGFPISLPDVGAILEVEKTLRDELIMALEKATDGEITGADMKRSKMLKDWLNNRGMNCTSIDAANVYLMLCKPGIPDDVRTVLLARQQLGTSATSKFKSMQLRTTESCPRVRGGFQYYGAAKTGRWAGRGTQPHNMVRPSIKDEEVDYLFSKIENQGEFYDAINSLEQGNAKCLASLVRGVVKAPEGRTFMTADYSAIEARGVFWLAEDEGGIKAFADSDAGTGAEIYKIMAGDIFNVPADEVDKDQRSVGKQAILGCGYGMGSNKFEITCDSYGIQLPVSSKVIVDKYRKKFGDVPSMWYALEDAAVLAVGNPNQKVKCGGVWFKKVQRRGRWILICALPSERMLVYQEPRLGKKTTPWGAVKDTVFYKAMVGRENGGYHWAESDIWGGTWLENICQAVCRDLLAHSLKQVHDEGLNTILHVHDEIVVEVPDSYGESELNHFYDIVKRKPKWAEGFPVQAEGWIGNRYKKD